MLNLAQLEVLCNATSSDNTLHWPIKWHLVSQGCIPQTGLPHSHFVFSPVPGTLCSHQRSPLYFAPGYFLSCHVHICRFWLVANLQEGWSYGIWAELDTKEEKGRVAITRMRVARCRWIQRKMFCWDCDGQWMIEPWSLKYWFSFCLHLFGNLNELKPAGLSAPLVNVMSCGKWSMSCS